MKPKPGKKPKRQARSHKTWDVQESATTYGRTTEVSVRQAKDNFSSLLLRAAGGEDIVVTSDGRPKAMITRIKAEFRLKPWRMHPDLVAKLPPLPDSTPLIRAERDAQG